MNETLHIPTREEKFAQHKFEWVKTERAGDICTFSNFTIENDVEYVCFVDNSRIRIDLIGDVVLMHKFTDEILGAELKIQPSPLIVEPRNNTIIEHLRIENNQTKDLDVTPVHQVKIEDPVVSILEKTKKKTEKINLVLTLKLPAPDIYSVIKDNFENVDEILLENIMDQIKEDILREALRKELQNIYSKKKKV